MEKIEEIKKIFSECKKAKLAYFFGSRALGQANEQSDYDFAVYFDSRDVKEMSDLRFSLMGKLSRLFKTDKIDLVVLNLARGTDLKYNIIKEGIVVHEVEPFRVLLEPRILHEYFDFNIMMERNGLSRPLEKTKP